MRRRLALAALLMLATAAGAAADSAADETERMTLAGGAWHAGPLVPCAGGIVTSVHSRLEETGSGAARFDSGVVVEISLPAAPRFLNGQRFRSAAVVHYQGEPQNRLMQSEKRGDKVQACLVSFPTPTHDVQTGRIVCDPNVDPRGMVYRVFDYKRRAAYMGPDSQHSCGGA